MKLVILSLFFGILSWFLDMTKVLGRPLGIYRQICSSLKNNDHFGPLTKTGAGNGHLVFKDFF